MTTKEIREKETEHLKHELVEQRKHLFDLRSQAVTEKLEDPSQLRKTSKDIARMQDDPAPARDREQPKRSRSRSRRAKSDRRPAKRATAARRKRRE